jgi:hypothetical protein
MKTKFQVGDLISYKNKPRDIPRVGLILKIVTKPCHTKNEIWYRVQWFSETQNLHFFSKEFAATSLMEKQSVLIS